LLADGSRHAPEGLAGRTDDSGQVIGVPLTLAAKRTADSKSAVPTVMARLSGTQPRRDSSKRNLSADRGVMRDIRHIFF